VKINAHHLYRVNHHALEIEKRKTIDLKDEQNQLLIQESSKSGNGRISEYAKSKLKMNPPRKKTEKNN
jgi:cell division protein FtsL